MTATAPATSNPRPREGSRDVALPIGATHRLRSRRSLSASLAVAIGILGLTPRSVPASVGPVSTELDLVEAEVVSAPAGTHVDVRLHNPTASKVISQMVNDAGYWADASTDLFKNKPYDEIRLKDTSEGYMPMITGEGDQDFPHDVVADVVFTRMGRLPTYMSGAKRVARLGEGFDQTVGAPYVDTFWFLDLTLFYVVFPQRMYKRHDEASNQTFLWFEKLEPSFVSADLWATYQQRMEEEKAKVDTRWALNSVLEVGEVYGLFIVGPGQQRPSRVTFVSKITFGDDAGWIAKFGSQLPPVIKSGLKSGFKASVAIAAEEVAKRQPPATPAE